MHAALKFSCCLMKVILFRSFLSREDFGRIPELAINPLNERIIDSFYFNSDENE